MVERDKKLYEDFLLVQKTMSYHASFSAYRKALKNADPPLVPYLGMYLTDLTFIEEGNRDYLPVEGHSDVINLDKMRKVGAVIQELLLFQQKRYRFERDGIFDYLLNDLVLLSEDECYKRSREVETKEMIEAFERKQKKR